MNYTKGKWQVSSKSFGDCDTNGKIVIRSPNGIVAMACTINEGLANAEANANLIAAAPDMYEALKEIYDAELGPDIIRILSPWFEQVGRNINGGEKNVG